jgi:hypothetical protein
VKGIAQFERFGIVRIGDAGLPRELVEFAVHQSETFSEAVRGKRARCEHPTRTKVDAPELGVPIAAGTFEEDGIDREEAFREGSRIVREMRGLLVVDGFVASDTLARGDYAAKEECEQCIAKWAEGHSLPERDCVAYLGDFHLDPRAHPGFDTAPLP